MDDALKGLVDGRSGSAVSELLTRAPKLVEAVEPLLAPAPSFSLKSLFAPKAGTAEQDSEYDSAVEPEDEYIPLTAAEIEIKAETKSEMWAAILAMFFDVLNRYIATQSLRPGDKELVQAYEDELRILTYAPTYPPEHPYHMARLRWEDFKSAISEAKKDAALNDVQIKLLKRAIKADIEKKNRRKKLKEGSIAEVLFEIAMAKAGTQGTMFMISKFTNLSDSIR
jgi:hypothetical protein